MLEQVKPAEGTKDLQKHGQDYAPIALFVYNRLSHTQQTITSLLENRLASQSDLFVFADGAKRSQDEAAVNAVRDFVCKIEGFQSVTVIARDQNLGLARSIISGVSQVVNKFGRVIVMEDDLLVSPYFLDYMNQALDLYANDVQVISVHGYTPPVGVELPETFFIRGADCWGWATWKRGWDLFEADGKVLYEAIMQQGLEKEFDLGGAYGYTRMLQQQIQGKIDSWAIRWHASAFIKGKLTLYPGRSLVHNAGHDQSGTHCQATNAFDVAINRQPVRVRRINTTENPQVLRSFAEFQAGLKAPFPVRIRRKIMRLLSLKKA